MSAPRLRSPGRAEPAEAIERFVPAARDALEVRPDDVPASTLAWRNGYYGHLRDPAQAAQHVRFHADLLALGGVSARGRTVPRLEVGAGDVTSLPAPDRSVDLGISNEAISHYLDIPGFLAEASRVLKPGGVLLVSDRHNATNPRVVRETHELWAAVESETYAVTIRQARGGDRIGVSRPRRRDRAHAGAPDGRPHGSRCPRRGKGVRGRRGRAGARLPLRRAGRRSARDVHGATAQPVGARLADLRVRLPGPRVRLLGRRGRRRPRAAGEPRSPGSPGC